MTITTDYLTTLDRFRLIVKKRVTSHFAGSRPSTVLGRGTTIKDHRQYAPGDDFRLIDWKIFAKTDNLYIKQFEEDKDLTTHIIVDASASMDFGSPITKFEFASMIGIGFAHLAVRDNDKFQFATFSNSVDVFQSSRAPSHLLKMVDHLNSLKVRGNTKFGDAVLKYKRVIGSKALVILLSDFLYDAPQIEAGLNRLAGNEIRVIQVLDSTEVDLPVLGEVNLHDAETSTEMKTFVSQRMKQQYLYRMQQHNSHIEEICNRLNAKYNRVTTDMPIFDAFWNALN
ncbi:DUF58 domain-containing protein [Candidatus Woesearchaeota archaeon]|nr:DUF58 domain-containing protein [Candidatus Woesearchaeota archaeon]